MKKLYVLVLLVGINLQSCGPFKAFRQAKKEAGFLNTVRKNKVLAKKAVKAALEEFPEMGISDTVTVRDTVIIEGAHTETEKEANTHYSRDEVERLKRIFIEREDSRRDSFKMALTERDMYRELAGRAAQSVIENGRPNTDTSTIVGKNARSEAYLYKGKLRHQLWEDRIEVPTEKRVPCPPVPKYIPREWLSFWQSWVAMGVGALLAFLLFYFLGKALQRKA
jgi:hypothetical protein